MGNFCGSNFSIVVNLEEKFSNEIHCLCFLNDGRLASGKTDGTICIYNLETFQCELSLIEHSDYVSSLALLDNGFLLSSSADSSLKIWEFNENSAKCIKTLKMHNRCILDAIQLTGNRIGSVGEDQTFIVWKGFQDNETGAIDYKSIEKLTEHNVIIDKIFELKKNEYFMTAGKDDSIGFWDSINYLFLKRINKIHVKCIYELGNNKILCGGKQSVFVFDVVIFEIEMKISLKNGTNITFNSLILLEKNIFFCGAYIERDNQRNGSLVVVDIKAEKIIFKEIFHNISSVDDMTRLNENKFLFSDISGISIFTYEKITV